MQNDREKLIEILSKYFDITDPYAYNLTRDKTAFAVGTMSLEDFEEFNEETVADIADYLIANGVVIQEEAEWILTDGWRCSRCLSLCPFTCDEQEDLSNYCQNCGKKMKEVK